MHGDSVAAATARQRALAELRTVVLAQTRWPEPHFNLGVLTLRTAAQLRSCGRATAAARELADAVASLQRALECGGDTWARARECRTRPPKRGVCRAGERHRGTGATPACRRLHPYHRAGVVGRRTIPEPPLPPSPRSVPMPRAHTLPPWIALAIAAAASSQSILPPPPVPAGNPLTAAKALLGKALFWDEQLSSSRTVACGTCHVFTSGGSDPRATAPTHPGQDGIFGTADDRRGSPGVVRHDAQGQFVADPTFGIRVQATARKAQSPINAAYGIELFWDGRASDTFVDPVTGAVVLSTGGALESQIAGPPVNDVEMSHFGRSWIDIAMDLAPRQPLALATQVPAPLQAFVQGQTYAQLFQQVFGSPGVTPVRIIFALASYERTLISDQSPLDRVLAGQATLSPQQAAGRFEFQGLCAVCHQDLDPPVLATGPVLHEFRNVGVRPYSEDLGRANVTSNPLDSGKFKVPGLRNVALRAPFFHTGGMATLTDVVDFYARGGDFHINQDVLVASMPGQVSAPDRLNLVAFLNALTDPRVAQGLPPFDRPRLASEGPYAPFVGGHGTPGTGGLAPEVAAVMPAYLGNPHWAVGVDHAMPGQPAWLVVDFTASATPVSVFGLDIFLALSPSTMLLPAGLTVGTAPRGGAAQLVLPVPGDPLLAGLPFYGQWVVADPLGPIGLTTSAAFAAAIF